MTMENKFLGNGWQYPPQFTRSDTSATMSMASGPDNISRSLKALLTTNAGERLMRPDYGGGLDSLLFEPVDQRTIAKIRNRITDAILLYEPRVNLLNVNVFQDQDDAGLLNVSIEYTIRTTNSRFNLVYPFHIHEASSVA